MSSSDQTETDDANQSDTAMNIYCWRHVVIQAEKCSVTDAMQTLKGRHWSENWHLTSMSKSEHSDLIFTSVLSFKKLVTVLYSQQGFKNAVLDECTARLSHQQWRSVNLSFHHTWWTMMNQRRPEQYVCISWRHTLLRLSKAEWKENSIVNCQLCNHILHQSCCVIVCLQLHLECSLFL
jgi:hypothetical protein